MAAPGPVAEFVFGVLFPSLPDAAFVVACAHGTVVCANDRLADLLGCVADDLLEVALETVLPPDADRVDILARPGRYEDVALRGADGYPIYVELTVAHVHHPELGLLAACLARDTTQRRELERELIAKHTALFAAHRELERLVGELRAAHHELEQRNQEISVLAGQVSRVGWRAALGELAAGIAHHLNNPVGALSSSLRAIGARLDAHPDHPARDELRQLLQRARGAASRVEEHVAAVVRLHRAGALDSAPRRLDLARELDTALAMFTGRLGRVAVSRTYDRPLVANVPQDPLHHVLGSLIENALAAMPDGGELSIEVNRREDAWVVGIEDTGRGLPVEVLSHLGDPIAAAARGGGGLGLATAQRLARLWGGDLAHCARDRGARFEIRVPAGAPDPDRVEHQP